MEGDCHCAASAQCFDGIERLTLCPPLGSARRLSLCPRVCPLQFIEKFQEVKEATRLAAQKAGNNGVAVRPAAEGEAPPTAAAAPGGGGELHGGGSGSSPKHQPAKASLPQTTAEAQLRYENDRLKLALAQSSANAKKWEVELQTLKNNNGRLTCALQESTANVEEWKRQLQALKEENAAMRARMLDLEASGQGGGAGGGDGGSAAPELRRELAALRARADLLDRENKQKEKVRRPRLLGVTLSVLRTTSAG